MTDAETIKELRLQLKKAKSLVERLARDVEALDNGQYGSTALRDYYTWRA